MAITPPVTLLTCTSRPVPEARRCGSAARLTRYAVSRLRASERCQRSGSVAGRSPPSVSGSLVLVMPALLTTTSRRPWHRTQPSTRASATDSSVRSPTWPLAVTPSRCSSATRSCTRSVVAATTTVAPRRPSSRAVARPMPSGLPAPVTRATRPACPKGEDDSSDRFGGQQGQHRPDDGRHDDERVEPLHQVADRGGDGDPDAQRHADHPGVVEQEVDAKRATHDAQHDRAAEALPRLLGTDGRRHGVLAAEDARGIPPDVAADRGDEEDEHPADAVRRRQQ